jgi:hypothetical protein
MWNRRNFRLTSACYVGSVGDSLWGVRARGALRMVGVDKPTAVEVARRGGWPTDLRYLITFLTLGTPCPRRWICSGIQGVTYV